MTIYEENLAVLQSVRPDLYDALQNAKEEEEQILVGDALDGETFLAVLRGEAIIPLNSTYHPTHEAERYVAQFESLTEEHILLLFGFCNGGVVEKVLSEECPIGNCIVYEPSLSIFLKAMEEYDLRALLSNNRLLLLIEGINGVRLERMLDDIMNYENWRRFLFQSLSMYQELFNESYQNVKGIYKRMRQNKRADLNSLVRFAQAGLINETKALKWMIDCRTLDGMTGKFPTELPCIVVAAGPSLEKNVDVLKQVKGKAFIICVDTALTFLLERGIVPNLACTVDPLKGASYFTRPELSDIPMAVSTDSDYRSLEAIEDVKPVYMSTTNDYCQRLFRQQGATVEFFDGGGSVGTVCFQIGVELGFHTIIIIGQDLAFTDDKAHAGKGQVQTSDFLYNALLVDGYYGGKILTRGDFKYYIDWYNMRIPELTDREIINATEGGAKLKGAVQMPLQEAVDTYCKLEYDIAAIWTQIPKLWPDWEAKHEFYDEIKKKYRYFYGFRRRVKEGIASAERAVFLLKRGTYQTKELHEIDKRLNVITKEVSEQEGMVILVKRMIDTEVTVTDDLYETEDNLELESIRLYKKMEKYLTDLYEALEELLPIWKEVLQEINSQYHFE